MICFRVFIFYVLQLILNVSAKGYYTVIAPGTLFSHHDYSVAIAVRDANGPSVITVGIVGPSLNATRKINFNHRSELLTHKFHLPELDEGEYNLTIHGKGSLNFYNTTRLNHERNKGNVFVQTDKGAYRPGEVVRFRVIFLDHTLRPIQFEDILSQANVLIEDSNGIRVKKFSQLNIQKGVFTGKFELSHHPVLGTWRIVVKLYENLYFGSKTVHFYVEEYELPRFDVRVTASNRVSIVDGTVVVDIAARYSYGKMVNGKVIIIGQLQPKELFNEAPIIMRSGTMNNGRSVIEFTVEKLKNALQSAAAFKITAVVEESFTGTRLNASTITTLYTTRFSMLCKSSETCNTFTPKKGHQVIYEIRRVDGNFVNKTENMVELTYTENLNQRNCYKFQAKMNPINGLVTFEVENLPDLNLGNYYDAYLEFEKEKQRVDRVYPKKKYSTGTHSALYSSINSKDDLKIELQGEALPHHTVTALVNSSKPLKYFVYIIMGNDNILEAKSVEVKGDSNTAKIQFKVTIDMVPTGKIYVHYLEHGIYYYSEIKFDVKWNYKNILDIDVPQNVEVGKLVTIKIRTLPDSFVSLMAVDQNTLLYKSNNDFINRSALQSKLTISTSETPTQEFSPYPGEISGVITLTNGHYDFSRKKNQMKVRAGTNRIKLGDDASNNTLEPIVRQNFSETWIFEDITDTPSGHIYLERKVPDSITSWVMTGLSVNEKEGIAISYPPHSITTFQPFFITVRLPRTLKRGEGLSIPALIFNYLQEDLKVTATLHNTERDFSFISPSDEEIYDSSMSFNLTIPANSNGAVNFWIRPNVLGNILLKLTASSTLAGDTLQKSLKVVPEGITEYRNEAILVNVKNDEKTSGSFNLSFPEKKEKYVYDSEYAEFSAGDIMGPLLNYLITLTDVQTLVGESAVTMFVTNIQLLRYLKEFKNSSDELTLKLKSNLEQNYQNLLRSRHQNGGFKSFDKTKPSTWLTAYVIRYLILAREYIDIDPKILKEGLVYMASNYKGNGEFKEGGSTIYLGLDNDIWVTANVVIALLEEGTYNADMTQESLSYLYEKLNTTDDIFANAIAIYAIQKSGDSSFNITKQLADFEKRAISDNNQIWWEYAGNQEDTNWQLRSKDLSVVLTSYILLSLLNQSEVVAESNIKVVKYLIGQRNREGEFANDIDTTISTEAIIEFARKSGYANGIPQIELKLKTRGKAYSLEKNFNIDFEDLMEMQSIELPEETRQVKFEVEGEGSALLQVSYQYNWNEDITSSSFTVTYETLDARKDRMYMNVCVINKGTSELIVMEVTLPSGYEADTGDFGKILENALHVDSINENTVIRIFFQNLKKNKKQCIEVRSIKAYDIVAAMPTPIIVYDYHDRSKKAVVFYH